VKVRFLVGAAMALSPLALMLACASKSSTDTTAVDAATDRGHLNAPIHPDASCLVTIETPDLLPGTHVPVGSQITWSSNPPSSGPHYPVWANFQEYDHPIDLGYVVHDLEHGGIVLFYKCDDGAACDAIVAGLRQVRDAVPTDPKCDPSIRVRVTIVPDPQLDVPVAAAAWGWTYKAACLDLPTLEDFAKTHYGQGTEDLCAPGDSTL
jgi:hypothetical protein